jgi:hypothetical protein
MWKMKFEVDMVMKGLFEAFQTKFKTDLPTKEKMIFDLTDNTEKKQHNAFKNNQKEMMQFELPFSNVSLLNKLNCVKRRDKTYLLTGRAHNLMSTIVKE